MAGRVPSSVNVFRCNFIWYTLQAFWRRGGPVRRNKGAMGPGLTCDRKLICGATPYPAMSDNRGRLGRGRFMPRSGRCDVGRHPAATPPRLRCGCGSRSGRCNVGRHPPTRAKMPRRANPQERSSPPTPRVSRRSARGGPGTRSAGLRPRRRRRATMAAPPFATGVVT